MNIKNDNSERQKRFELIKKLYTGLITLDDIKKNYTDIYLTSIDQFENTNRMYYKDHNPTPEGRVNLVITGSGGSGKTTISHLLPFCLGISEKDTFVFTDIEAGFLNYTDQKAIIWDEGRTWKLNQWGIEKFLTATNTGKYNNAFINVKYGAVKLSQSLNIINSSQKNRDFLLGLTDRHSQWDNEEHQKILTDPENIDQINRRFVILLDTDKKVIKAGEYNTIIKGFIWNETIPNNKDFTHFEEKFLVEIPTTKDNFEAQLLIFTKWLSKMIDLKKFCWDFSSLEKYYDPDWTNPDPYSEAVNLNKLDWNKIKKAV